MTNNEAVEILKEMKRQSEAILNNPTAFYSEKIIVGGCETMKKHIEAYNTAISALLTSYDVNKVLEQLKEASFVPGDRIGVSEVKIIMADKALDIVKAEKKE